MAPMKAYFKGMAAGFYMALGAALAFGTIALIGGLFLTRLKRHLQKNMEAAIGQQLGLSRRMTEIIIQLQQNQSKQDEQLQKLAEFSLRVKKELQVVVERQANIEADLPANSDTKPKYLN